MVLRLIFITLLFSFNSHSNEESIYDFEWMDQDKEVYVLQNRVFQKNQSLILSVLGSKTMSNKFADTYYGVVKGAYFFNEDWGIEGVGAFGTSSENTTADAVRVQNAVPFSRIIDQYYGGMIVWAPLYGKFNAFDKILYLDWFLGAGLASISTSDNRKEFDTSTDRSKVTSSHAGLIWETGSLFYLNQSWMIRFESQGIHFQADHITEETGSNVQSTNKIFFHHYDLNLGLAVKF